MTSPVPASPAPISSESPRSVQESPAAVSQTSQEARHAEAPGVTSEPLTVLTIDDFASLEERVLRAVSLVRRERKARQVAEERLLVLESQMLAQAPAVERLQQEVEILRVEREQVRQRVERLLSQLDALEL